VSGSHCHQQKNSNYEIKLNLVVHGPKGQHHQRAWRRIGMNQLSQPLGEREILQELPHTILRQLIVV